jgi:hypothetical protein
VDQEVWNVVRGRLPRTRLLVRDAVEHLDDVCDEGIAVRRELHREIAGVDGTETGEQTMQRSLARTASFLRRPRAFDGHVAIVSGRVPVVRSLFRRFRLPLRGRRLLSAPTTVAVSAATGDRGFLIKDFRTFADAHGQLLTREGRVPTAAVCGRRPRRSRIAARLTRRARQTRGLRTKATTSRLMPDST